MVVHVQVTVCLLLRNIYSEPKVQLPLQATEIYATAEQKASQHQPVEVKLELDGLAEHS